MAVNNRRRAADPTTAPETLVVLAESHPAEVLQNPVLPLLELEDPTYPARGIARRVQGIRHLKARFTRRGVSIPDWIYGDGSGDGSGSGDGDGSGDGSGQDLDTMGGTP